MARHSKWHKVRQFKGALDAKRAASFTKLAREITVSVREKGADPSTNVRLKIAIERAKKASMTKETIERAVLRGVGGGAEGQLESPTYEAYGPGGVAMIIECMTDNKNRTTNDVKHLVTKAGGTFAASGAVTYLFDRKGVVRVTGNISSDQERAFIEAGAEDIKDGEIISAPQDLAHVVEAAQNEDFQVESVDMEWIPKAFVETDEASGTLLEELIEQLEELDDVRRVYTNAG